MFKKLKSEHELSLMSNYELLIYLKELKEIVINARNYTAFAESKGRRLVKILEDRYHDLELDALEAELDRKASDSEQFAPLLNLH